jgi:hypothetical protein
MRATPLLLALGCAGGAHTIAFKPVSNAAAPPVSYSVGHGRVVGSDLDISEESGCIRGSWGHLPINFCRDGEHAATEQRWSGSSGQFVVVPSEKNLSVTGVLILDTGRTVSMDQFVRIGEGPQWDELRRHPGLLALAATMADLQGARLAH